jgi:hypothetical protein
MNFFMGTCTEFLLHSGLQLFSSFIKKKLVVTTAICLGFQTDRHSA